MLISGQDILKLDFTVDGATRIRRSLSIPEILHAEEVVQTLTHIVHLISK